MLSDYSGGSNSNDIWPYLVGETIQGVLTDRGDIYVLFTSGTGLRIWCSDSLCWAKVGASEIQSIVTGRIQSIRQSLGTLGSLEELQRIVGLPVVKTLPEAPVEPREATKYEMMKDA